MHALTGWFIRNPVAANLLMGLILFLGAQTALSMRIEGFPRVPAETVEIAVEYPDATAEQVDQLVTQKIEQALEGLEGVRSITSESVNGIAQISVRRAGGEELQAVLDRVRLRVDALTDLPKQARRPVIETSAFDFPALYVNLHGEADQATLQTLARRLKEELLAQPELSRLKVWGLMPRHLRIEVDPESLRQRGLTVEDLARAIQSNSLDFKAGQLQTEGGRIFLRADGRALYARDYGALPVIERPDGSPVTLRDLATIEDGFAEDDFQFRFNGAPTVGMEVVVGQKENLLEISRVVRRVVDEAKAGFPAGIEVTVWGDSADYISDRLALLRSNGLQGLLLVSLILSIFLNVRLAFWVAMGIPVAVLGALAVSGSRWVDYSLNDVTTFGLIVVLGILVDDAVVVGDSVFEERRKTRDAIEGTERGVRRVAVATVFGVLTTIAAFYPMLLIDNALGRVLASFSGIVILALVFSLIESKLILPAHLARVPLDDRRPGWLARGWGRVQDAAQAGLAWFRDRVYRPVLIGAVRHRYAVLVLFVAAATAGLGLMAKGKIKTVFFPDVPGQVVTVSLEMDARAPFDLTRANVEHIAAVGRELNEELRVRAGTREPPIRTFFSIIESAGSARIYAEMLPVAERPEVSILDVVRTWRERIGSVEGATELELTGSEALAGGFQVRLVSRDTGALTQASQEMREFLVGIEGASNVRDILRGGQPELRLRLRPDARNLGFTTEVLATQIGYGFGGAEVARVRREGAEVRVVVRNTAAARDTIDDLLQTRLRSATGSWVPLGTVVEIEGAYTSGAVTRRDGKRMNTVSASIDRDVVAPEEVGQAVFEQLVPGLEARYPSVQVLAAGELEEMGEIRSDLVNALILAAVLIYVLMAVPLRSYWQPFVILAIVPFGFVAAAVGHMMTDVSLSLLSFFGMLALTGVIVNDSLVMITRYNEARDAGEGVADSLRVAGTSRFRAIFLTTATTVIGLLPLLTETSEQAQYLIPAAVSLAFGELFGTALMLILVPVLLAIAEDLLSLFGSAPTNAPPQKAGTDRTLARHDLTIAALLRVFRRRISFTWVMILAETTMMAVVPLFIGFAIDDLMQGNLDQLGRLAALMGALIVVSVVRRVYDTRVYGTVRVELGKAQVTRSTDLPVSALNARLDMGRELVDFLEHTLPEALAAAVQLLVAVAILYSFSPILAVAGGVAAGGMVAVYAAFHRRFYRLNQGLNQQREKQVGILAERKLRPTRVHLLRLRTLEVRLSDAEAVLYGAVFVVLLGMVLFNLWFSATALAITVGMIFSVISYSWEFIESSLALPMTLQNWSRLSEIMQRLNEGARPAEALSR